MPPLDIAVCAVVTALMHVDRDGVCPDDERIFGAICDHPDAIRMAIMRLVEGGIFRSGDGYLREVPRG